MLAKLLIAIALFFGSLPLGWTDSDSVRPVAPGLKQRQPHWRPKIAETFQSGQPERVLFYEQIGDANEAPVKQVAFYSNGQIKNEVDLIEVAEDSKGAVDWKSTIVPHGMSIAFFQNGQIEKVAFYDRGVLHGEMKLFFSDGKLHGQCMFNQGERHGQLISFYEDGSKAEETTYENGKTTGESIKYHPKGNRASLIPYENGVPHGLAMEWYPNGALKANMRYQNGLYHSDGEKPRSDCVRGRPLDFRGA